MWRGDVPTGRNPMELVSIPGATKRVRKPRSLTVEEFRKLLQHLKDPFRTMALVYVCFGLRITSLMALVGVRWRSTNDEFLSSQHVFEGTHFKARRCICRKATKK